MKVLLLAAGYATRLYPLTKNKPKPLLPVAGRPVLEFILDLVEPIKAVDEIFVVTNKKFHADFEDWKAGYKGVKKISIVNDGTLTNDDRIGATGDIDFVIKEKDIKDDLLVLAGDNIFKTGLADFMSFASSKRPSISIGLYDVKDLELAKKYGIVSVDSDNKIRDFREKPKEPTSTLAAECLYFFPKEKIGIMREYLSVGGVKDAPGYFLEWLYKREAVFGYVFEGDNWFDIGDMRSYEEANRIFKQEA
ncbi:MAG: nucleotidyltransferase family protein [Candidatus Omnitrophica bacterium]|nr:nucleotidyltransferase family protein [Candidatus Omnitrophota bacterium]